MKIAVTAAGPGLESRVDPRFGRCPYFVIVETDDLSVESMENPSVRLGGGAGVQSAQIMADRGVEYVLTGNCGPNAYHTLSAAKIDIVAGCSGTVREVVESFTKSRPSSISRPNVVSHFGMVGGVQVEPRQEEITGSGSQTVAHVDEQSCSGCGACVDVCPVKAISLRHDRARIDSDICIACGVCVSECPTGSIRLG